MKTLVQTRMVTAIDAIDFEKRINLRLESLDTQYGDKLIYVRDIKYAYSISISDAGFTDENFSALIIFEVKGES